MTNNLETVIQNTENIVFRSNALSAEGKSALAALYRQIAADLPAFWSCRNMDVALRCMLVLMQHLQAAEDETAQLWATAIFKLVYAATTRDAAGNDDQLTVLNALLLCCTRPAIVSGLVETALWEHLVEEHGDEAYEHDALQEYVSVGSTYGVDQMLLATFMENPSLVATNALVKARCETIVENVRNKKYGDPEVAPDIRQMAVMGAAIHEALTTFVDNDIELFGIFPG